MLRPATPLAVILFLAFVMLVLSVISTPLIKGIKIASDGGFDFGVFGYCQGSQCTAIQIGYDASPHGLLDGDFSLPASTRHSLSSLLIVHPVAALFTLVLLILALTAHLHSPSHSPRYLLAMLVLTIPAFLLSLLSFLIDILMFIPHLSFGGWLVLGATILLAASSVITCAMRRTLVSRKARKKRIAENDEMNGNNFYKTQSNTSGAAGNSTFTAPTANGALGADKLPAFATYEGNGKGDDDRAPLNSRSNSNKAPTDGGFSRFSGPESDDGSERYGEGRTGGAPRLGQNLVNRGGKQGFGGGRDQYGNPLPPSNAFGGPPPRRDPSDPRNRYDSPSRGPPFGGRGGRGGYPPRGGRAGYGVPPPPGGWRGAPPPAGYGGDGRGGAMGMMAGGMMGRGGRGGPPPPGYNGYGPPSPARGQGYPPREPSPYGGGGYGRGAPPSPGYDLRQSPAPPLDPNGYNGYYDGRQRSPGPPVAAAAAMRREPSPPPPLPLPASADRMPVGQAIEMDATTGSPSPSHGASPNIGGGAFGAESTGGAGNGAQGRHQSPMRNPSGGLSPTSVYSGAQEYVPPRAAWNDNNHSGSPLNSVPEAHPAELPSPPPPGHPSNHPGHARANSGDNYYEDVAPRFADARVEPLNVPSAVPASLTPGYGTARSADAGLPQQHNTHLHPDDRINQDGSYEDLHTHSRSPAESDNSQYTSVSQRGVNPKWPGPGHQDPGLNRRPVPAQAQAQHQRDMLFQNNSEFELPGGSSRPGGASRGAGPMPPIAAAVGGGRYPDPNDI